MSLRFTQKIFYSYFIFIQRENKGFEIHLYLDPYSKSKILLNTYQYHTINNLLFKSKSCF